MGCLFAQRVMQTRIQRLRIYLFSFYNLSVKPAEQPSSISHCQPHPEQEQDPSNSHRRRVVGATNVSPPCPLHTPSTTMSLAHTWLWLNVSYGSFKCLSPLSLSLLNSKTYTQAPTQRHNHNSHVATEHT